MSERQFIPDGYCGLFCGSCGIYLATKNGTEKQFAEENNMPLETVSCYGCRTDKNPVWCTECKLKSCARTRGFDFCYECAEYPCENLEAFKNDPLYPYHREVYDYMETIKNKGKEAWLREMKTRWSCSQCEQEASWWDLSCKKCGQTMNGYKKP